MIFGLTARFGEIEEEIAEADAVAGEKRSGSPAKAARISVRGRFGNSITKGFDDGLHLFSPRGVRELSAGAKI